MTPMPPLTPRGADISACGRYRYRLWRIWDAATVPLGFVMLNPSTADADVDDPTIRRCIAFAKRDGLGGIYVLNLFAYRATDPRALLRLGAEAIGPRNDATLDLIGWDTPSVVCAWGAHAVRSRAEAVVQRLRNPGGVLSIATALLPRAALLCLGTNKDGSPRHPLYVPADAPLVRWEGYR